MLSKSAMQTMKVEEDTLNFYAVINKGYTFMHTKKRYCTTGEMKLAKTYLHQSRVIMPERLQSKNYELFHHTRTY